MEDGQDSLRAVILDLGIRRKKNRARRPAKERRPHVWLKVTRISLRVHVPKWHILWPQSTYMGTTLRPKYILFALNPKP